MIINKDQVNGRAKLASGKVKEVAGKLVGNTRLELQGIEQRVLGALQARFGDAKSNAKAGKKNY